MFHMLQKNVKPMQMLTRMPVFRFSSSEGNKTLFVDGLDTNVSEEEIRTLFKDHGEINLVNMLNYRSDLSGKCFVEFTDADAAVKAAAALKDSGVDLNGQNFKVSLARQSGHKDSKRGR